MLGGAFMGDVIYWRAKENGDMADIFEVARYFLSKCSMNHKKLQKLCYYAQAWHLAIKDRPLMNTWFEAWVHGPVSPELYSRYKDWGGLMIPQVPDNSSLSIEQKGFLDKIFFLYGDYSGDELEKLTHGELPWKNARSNYPDDAICRNTINNDDMKKFYKEYLH